MSTSATSVTLELDDASLVEQQRSRTGTSLLAGVANLLNTIIGGGILSLPFAFRSCGMLLGAALLLVMGAMSYFGNVLLLSALRHRPRVLSYEDLAQAALGRKGWVAYNVASLANCYGACLSYIIVVGDIVPPLLFELNLQPRSVSESSARAATLVVVALLVLLPLSAPRKMSSMKAASVFAIIIYFAFVATVVLVYCSEETPASGEAPALVKGDAHGLLQAVPLCAFAFVCQTSLFPIYQETRDPTERRMLRLSLVAFGIAGVLYIVVGAFSYASFGEEVQGDILLNLRGIDSLGVRLARLGFGASVCCTYPVLCFAARRSFDQLVFRSVIGVEPPARRLFAETALIVGSTLGLALVVRDVEVVFGFVGAIASTALSFVLPAAIFLGLCPAGATHRGVRLRVWCFLVMGVLLATVSLVNHTRDVLRGAARVPDGNQTSD